MTWFVIDADGSRVNLPDCSGDYQPSGWMFSTCLHDPDTSICRAHRAFFRQRARKEN